MKITQSNSLDIDTDDGYGARILASPSGYAGMVVLTTEDPTDVDAQVIALPEFIKRFPVAEQHKLGREFIADIRKRL